MMDADGSGHYDYFSGIVLKHYTNAIPSLNERIRPYGSMEDMMKGKVLKKEIATSYTNKRKDIETME